MNKLRHITLISLLSLLTNSLCGEGRIIIRTAVIGAQVTIDNNESVTMHGQELSCLVEDGLHLIMVTKEGYRPYIDTMIIHPKDNRLTPAWLEPISQKATRETTAFKRKSWEYQLANQLFALRWVSVGGGIATGLNLHVSLFNMRFGLFTIDPCLWGMNVPFFNGISHVKTTWLAHPRDRRSEIVQYEMAIPNQNVQFYYTPMIGFQLPFSSTMTFVLNAGPQISWTYIDWSYQLRDLPTSYTYTFTDDPFPDKGFQFDPVWFSVLTGILFNGRSDLLTYFKYQDGFFLGMEFRF